VASFQKHYEHIVTAIKRQKTSRVAKVVHLVPDEEAELARDVAAFKAAKRKNRGKPLKDFETVARKLGI